MAFLLSDARQFLADYGSNDTSARALRIYDRIAQDAQIELRRYGIWDFDKRIGRLNFQGSYSTGTVTTISDSTSLVGSGTTFTSVMDERYIRINSENVKYRITAYTNSTTLVIENYRGTGAAGLSYIITEDRLALPARFRSMAGPLSDNTSYVAPTFVSLDKIWEWNRVYRETAIPRNFSIEWQEDASIPQPYLWLYPAPASEIILDIPYYAWPPEITTGTDEFFLPLEAQAALRAIMLGLLFREQGNLQKAETQLSHAREMTVAHLGAFRAATEPGRMGEWTAEGDPSSGNMRDDSVVPLASGEPQWT